RRQPHQASRMNARQTAAVLLALGLGALSVAACSPQAPKGVAREALDISINKLVGDPNTCVRIGKIGTGDGVYQFGTHVTCGKAWPTCEGAATRTTDDLLKATAPNAAKVNSSCASSADGTRTVAWAAGPVEGHPELVYAASMEGTKTPPGVAVADKLKIAFKAGGL
ncbi:MAG TPA: hypothetical protein VFW47_09430, partial [Phenylobacterium sp.]|nr:hypothetical protein [Phenylobacterium sp.]